MSVSNPPCFRGRTCWHRLKCRLMSDCSHQRFQWQQHISDRSQKPLSMRDSFLPSMFWKWRTTNAISPCISASHQAVRRFVQVLIFGWDAPSTFLVYRGTKFREIGGCYPQDIVPYLLPSCVNVRCQWKINRTPFFSFVKAAQRLLSLRFGIRSRCFFQKKISKMTFFSFEWSWEKTSQSCCCGFKPKGVTP